MARAATPKRAAKTSEAAVAPPQTPNRERPSEPKRYEASKEELLDMALGVALDGLEGVLAEPGAQTGTAAERLQFVLRAAVQVLLDRLPYVTLLLRVRGNSVVEREALERRRAFDHEMSLLVREAQASGSVRPDVDSAIVTRLIFGMLNSTIEWYRPTGPIDRDALTHDILTVAFDGISSH